jgi:hypothetical protein
MEMLTPESAAALLATVNTVEVPQRPDVMGYAADMVAGHWGPSTITVDSDGKLLDGWRRCAAVLGSGVPIPVTVLIGRRVDGYLVTTPR